MCKCGAACYKFIPYGFIFDPRKFVIILKLSVPCLGPPAWYLLDERVLSSKRPPIRFKKWCPIWHEALIFWTKLLPDLMVIFLSFPFSGFHIVFVLFDFLFEVESDYSVANIVPL